MFEDKTYEKVLAEVLARAPAGIDTRQGSIYYDAVAGTCLLIAQYYADLSTAFDLVFLTTAVDEYLDMKGVEYGLTRHTATSAVYVLIYTGVAPPVGERFFSDGKYFVVIEHEEILCLQAEVPGEDSDTIIPGSNAVPVNTVAGLTSAVFGELLVPGIDTESDDDFRQRLREKVAGTAENGNRQHYKTWCEEVVGVGRARILPLWAGENTVKGVLIGTDGLPALESVVENVQEYIDPGATGLGNGVANIGAHFTAVGADALVVNVGFTVVLRTGATIEQAKTEAVASITEYLKSLALDTPETELAVLRISTIGALLYALPSVLDYSNLTLNAAESNIEIGTTQVAVLGEVNMSETVR